MNQMIKPKKIAIIRSRWHAEIVDKCVEAAESDLRSAGYGVDIIDVPGALEIPLLAKKLAESGQYAGIIGSAFVVNGGIYRHDFVSASVIEGLMRAQMDTGVPVFSTVLTPHNYQEVESMTDFFLNHFVEKGREVARAVAATLPLHEKLANGEKLAV